jgi:hypothetical protein
MMNLHSPPPAEGNFCDKHGKGLKPAIVQDWVRHGVNGEIHMTNRYYIRRLPWKGKEKLCFHLLKLTILNNFLSTVIQIITLTIQTDIGEGPNTGGWEGSLNLTRQKKVSPIHRPTQKFYIRHNRHWSLNRRVLSAVRVPLTTHSIKIKVFKMHCWVVLTEVQYIYNNLLMNCCLDWIYCTSGCTKTQCEWFALKMGCVLNRVSKCITKQEKQGTQM